MSHSLPHTLYTCPCTKNSTAQELFDRPPRRTEEASDEDEEEEQTFNPKSPRAKFALYPLEHLLFCNECHEIRCPRCYYEEALYFYCPTCLFEVQTNVVKCETNRCTRSCFQCPICISPLALQSFQNPVDDQPKSGEAHTARDGPCILSCLYCSWSSLDIGIKFDRPVNISGQLAKLRNFGTEQLDHKEPRIKDISADTTSENVFEPGFPTRSRTTDQYSQLAAFYKAQIADTAPVGQFSFSHSFGLDSPSQLSRLLSTYGVGGLKKQRERAPVMREALTDAEGLRYESLKDEYAIIQKMQHLGWDGMASLKQQSAQGQHTRFLSDVRPLATQLRSKRAKRCRTCRHVLVKLDQKRQRNKYDIRLVALNFLPTTKVCAMDPSIDITLLQPLKSVQFLLTFRNPMFDPIKVTLATPPKTPGQVSSKVTILCPQFNVGANTDAWEEALDDVETERKKARDALEGGQAIAGKVWEKGRNWTTVIVEVVPASLEGVTARHDEGEDDDSETDDTDPSLLEIPILVRLEYESEDTATGGYGDDSQARGKEQKVKREMVFWCVAAVGRIAEAS